jgi:DNA-binding NarL/FixJ family response regulator
MKSILDPSFRYTPSFETDVRKTFERIRRKQDAQIQEEQVNADPSVSRTAFELDLHVLERAVQRGELKATETIWVSSYGAGEMQENEVRWTTSPRRKKSMTKPVKRLNGHNVLTQTEKTTIALLAAGLTAKEIAHARGVQLRTVRVQIRCIFEKTGVRRQIDLVRLNHR